jgi:nucleoside-diphosphate-sugar epimerase
VHAVNPPYAQWQRELLPAARASMDLAEQLGARFLLPGNVYNFGDTMPPQLFEDTPQVATDRKGLLRIALEAELERRCAAGPLHATVIRAGDFYGAGTGNWFDLAIVKSIAARRLVYPGPLDVPHAWAYLPDVARTFVAVAQRPARDGEPFERFHFSGHTLTGAELLSGIETAATSLGLEAPRGWARGSFPWGLLRAGAALVPTWRELTQMRYLWSVPHALAGSALRRALGPQPGTAPAQALRAALIDLGHARGARAPAAVHG